MKPLWIIVRVCTSNTHTCKSVLFSHRLHILTLRSYFIALFPLCSLPCVMMWFLYMQLNKPSEPPTATETAPLSPGEVYYEPTGREPVTVTITHINMHTHTHAHKHARRYKSTFCSLTHEPHFSHRGSISVWTATHCCGDLMVFSLCTNQSTVINIKLWIITWTS